MSVTSGESFISLVREIEENLRLTERSKEALEPALSSVLIDRSCSPASVNKATVAPPSQGTAQRSTPSSTPSSSYRERQAEHRGSDAALGSGAGAGMSPSSGEGATRYLQTPQLVQPRGKQLAFGEEMRQPKSKRQSRLAQREEHQGTHSAVRQSGWSSSPAVSQLLLGATEGSSPAAPGRPCWKGQFGSPIHSPRSVEKENSPLLSTSKCLLSLTPDVVVENGTSGRELSGSCLFRLAQLLTQEAAAASTAVERCFQAAELELQALAGGARSGNCKAETPFPQPPTPLSPQAWERVELVNRLREQDAEISSLEGALKETSACLAASLRRTADVEQENALMKARLSAVGPAADTSESMNHRNWTRTSSTQPACQEGEAQSFPPHADNCRSPADALCWVESVARGCAAVSYSQGPCKALLRTASLVGESCSGHGGSLTPQEMENKRTSEPAEHHQSRQSTLGEQSGLRSSSPVDFGEKCQAAESGLPGCTVESISARQGQQQAVEEIKTPQNRLGVAKSSGAATSEARGRSTEDCQASREGLGCRRRSADVSGGEERAQHKTRPPNPSGSRQDQPHRASISRRSGPRRQSPSSWDVPSPPGLSGKASTALREALYVIRHSETFREAESQEHQQAQRVWAMNS